MSPYLARIQELILQNQQLGDEEIQALSKAIAEADKQWAIIDFKLDRTEKVKKTAAILLDETIAELELKRKAVEDQNRELEVEGALERVRTIAMAMQQPEDMLHICRSITQELQHLGLKEIRNVQTVIINPGKGTYLNYEFFDKADKEVVTSVVYDEHEVIKAFVQKVLSDPEAFFTTTLEGEGLSDWISYQGTSGQFVDPHSTQASSIHYYFYSIGEGALGVSTYAPLQDPQIDLFKRFRNVFALAYKRFTDIETAQAQAREAQVEAALERVRAQTMAMHSSNDLAKVSSAMFEQMKQLGGDLFAFGIVLCDKHENMVEQWHGLPTGKGMMNPFLVPIDLDHIHRYRYEQWKAGTELFFIEIPSDYIQRHFELMLSVPSVGSEINRMVADGYDFNVPEWEIDYGASFKHGYLLISSFKPFKEDKIFPRFAKVFDQAYTRFLDLQKAEDQAREAQVEAALEKVRARSLAMQKPDEIKQVAELLRSEMAMLGVEELETSSIYIPRNDQGLYECWYAIKDVRGSTRPLISDDMTLDLNDTWVGREMLQFVGSAEEKTSVLMKGEQRIAWINYCSQRSKVLEGYYGDEIPERTYHLFKFAYGYLGAASPGNISAESWSLLKRAAGVFSFAYTRFLDLQDAAARAREAQIELALERVRSRSMAMHHSSELSAVVDTLLREFTNLEFTLTFCIINLINEEDRSNTVWAANPETGKPPESYYMKFEDYPFHHAMWDAWKAQKNHFIYTIEGEEKKIYDEYLYSKTEFRRFPKHVQDANKSLKRYVAGFTFFKYSGLQTVSENHISDEDLAILERFGKVFEQSYTRFLDLQKAETQAREAQIEAALERVRSRTMAMQSSDELSDAAYVLFEQLNRLGVTHERINIGIVNEDDQTIDFWVTEQGGHKLSTRFSGRISEPTTISKAFEGWKKGERSITIDLQGDELASWLKYLVEEIRIPFKNTYLHNRRVQTIGFFSKGMLVVTSPEPLQNEAIYLLEKFAGVFDLTYTRFSDLKLAEAQAAQAEKDLIAIKEAKKKAEEALLELKAAQQQLVQSEKMASLGELTAGIAHEIQNPLNFVNNFSEVSHELVSEMKTALAEGDHDMVQDIINDLAANLEKINHHGKRADGIVKGMLQHSRSTSGIKEPTDVNNLCDEFLRLAYHGLRAKDKDFNTNLETSFQQDLPKVNLASQDIGRVLLNLVNNAFYAVKERMKAESKISGSTYSPQVTIATKKLGNRIQVSVQDNGNGIPEAIREKIFQPFFTTKPTGQGTGLGLSLSYDIIKAHGGEIRVESKEGEGTVFTILLPTV